MSSMSSYNKSTVGPFTPGDQRNEPQSVTEQHEKFEQGEKHSHSTLDSKDQRSIANRLGAQSKENDPSHHHNKDFQPEAELSKQDPTKPAKLHGNEPSKGAKIDSDLQAEDEQRLKEKGIKK